MCRFLLPTARHSTCFTSLRPESATPVVFDRRRATLTVHRGSRHRFWQLANFFSTLTLSGLQPLDAAGNPVTNAQFSSRLGDAVPENGVVPEPATLALTAFGSPGAGPLAARAPLKR